MKKIVFIMIATLMLPTLTLAQEGSAESAPTLSKEMKDSSIKFMKGVIKEAMDSILLANTSTAEKEKNFRRIFLGALDREYVARVVLGRVWRASSLEEQKNFLIAFEDLIVANWSGMFDKYSGQVIETREARPVRSKAGNQVEVISMITSADDPKAQPTKISWRLKQENGKFQVIDIVVEGVSMAMNYQQEYREIILHAQEADKNPMTELIAKIKEKTAAFKNSNKAKA